MQSICGRLRQRIAEGAKSDPHDKRTEPLAKALYWALEGDYMEGLGGIAWLKEIAAGLEEILFLCPGHQQAIQMKKRIEARKK